MFIDINNPARNPPPHSGDQSRNRLHPVVVGESMRGGIHDHRYHRRSPPYRSTSLETRSRTPSPTNDRYRVSPHPEYYGKTNLTDRSRSPSPPSSLIPPKRAEGLGPAAPAAQKPTELNFSNKRRNSRGSMPQMLPSPTVPPPDASSPSCINFPRLNPSPTHKLIPSPVSTTTTVSPAASIPQHGATIPGGASGTHRSVRQPELVQRKPSQRHRHEDEGGAGGVGMPPQVKCQSREMIDRQSSLQESRLRSNATLPRRRDVALNRDVASNGEMRRRPTSYPPHDVEEGEDSDSDDEGWC